MKERLPETVGCIGTILSVVLAFAAFVVSVFSLFQADKANGIAEHANNQSERHHVESTSLQARIAELEHESKRPLLTLVRTFTLGGNRFIATIQNQGERYAALLDVSFQQQRDMKFGSSSQSSATIPIDNTSPSIVVDLAKQKPLSKHPFSRPPVVEPGSILNIEILYPRDVSTGEFILNYSEGKSLGLGYIDPSSPFSASQ